MARKFKGSNDGAAIKNRMAKIRKKGAAKLLDSAKRGEIEREYQRRRAAYNSAHPDMSPWEYLDAMHEILRTFTT